MGMFFKQVGLLLWKNFSQRKRQFFRNAVEILWPLAIFIILVSVRKSRPPTKIHSTKNGPLFFPPRALPSAGALPFLQSYICNYNMTETFADPMELPNFSSTMLYRLVHDLAPVVTNDTRLQNIRVLMDNASKLMEDARKIFADLNKTDINMTDLFADRSKAIATLSTNNVLSNKTVTALVDSKIKVQGVMDFISKEASYFASNYRNISNIVNRTRNYYCSQVNLSQLFEFPPNVDVVSVRDEMCNISLSKFETLMIAVGGDMIGRSSEILKQLQKYPSFKDAEKIFNRVQKEAMAVQEEVQSTPQIQDLYNDISYLQYFAGLPTSKFLRLFVCGRIKSIPLTTSKTASSKVSPTIVSTRSMNLTTPVKTTSKRADKTTATTTATTTTKETSASATVKVKTTTTTPTPKTTKKPKYPGTGGGSDAKCNAIYPGNRTDCGWGGVTERECTAMKCCYDSSIPHTRYCFCPTNNKSSCCHRRRQLYDLVALASGNAKQMVRFFSMLLDGKIYYTPVNNKTNTVIKKISSFSDIFKGGLKYMKELRPIIKRFLDVSQEFLKDEKQLKEIERRFKEFIQYLNGTGYLPPNVLKEYVSVSESLKYLDYLNATYISKRSIMEINRVIKYFDMFSSASDCFNITSLFQPVATEEELVNIAISEKHAVNFLGSIVFLNLEDNKPFPEKIQYKLRFNSDLIPTTAKIKAKYWRPGPAPWGSLSYYNYRYILFGFVYLQDLVDRSIIEIVTNKPVEEPGLYMQQFPYPCYIQDKFISYLSNSLPFFMVIAWTYTVAMIIRSVVYEKELRLKEVMKVMGLSNTVHWISWFITSFISMAVSILILVILLKYGNIFIHSDVSLIICVLCFFATASIAMAFLVSVFFARANISAACGGIIYFFTYLPYPLSLWFEETITFSQKGAVSLFSTSAFGMSFKYIARWEEQGIGAQWSNLFENPMPNSSFSLGWAMIFLIIDTFVYLILMWYFEHVLPAQYGIRKPWYFPFTRSFWTGGDKRKIGISAIGNNGNRYSNLTNDSNDSVDSEMTINSGAGFEREPANLNVGVEIKDLVKIYSRNKKKAVDGLNLKLFEGQVTSLLGHNGAGKSTTMSILTGLFPPTSGTAVVYGDDIRTNIEGVRKSLGLCPQHNVLFDDLTVEEHMWFYGLLKGMKRNDIKKEIEKFLVDVGLPNKRRELSSKLSGGMKRKLSVAMAFIANSKTVILDEPTSGVDPYSRRSIWDLILKYKKDRTILLSTHYMDEADLLGDRISIISNGKLQCCGSPLYLKRHFGKGYFLTLTKDMDYGQNFVVDEISKFVSSLVPGAKLHDNFGTELSYVMPSAARLTGEFANLFQNLEENMKQYGIKNYGISDTTLEEVFLKACDEDKSALENLDTVSMAGPVQSRRPVLDEDNISLASIQSAASGNQLIPSSDSFNSIDDLCSQQLLVGPKLWMQQFKAILIKRFHHARRSKKGFFSQILLPAIFVIMSMIVSLIRPPREGLPSLTLSTSMYGKPNAIVLENLDINMFSENLTKAYIEVAKARYFNHTTSKKYWEYEKSRKCDCSSGNYECPANSYGSVKTHPTAYGDTLYDITGGDMNDYLLKTTAQFKRKRYGGAAFGEELHNISSDILSTTTGRIVSALAARRNAKIWYNLKGYHSLPVFINKINNAILRANLKDEGKKHEIVTYNHPMEYNRDQIEDQVMRQGIVDLFVAIFVITALAFVPASFVVYLVQDRISKSKHLQLVSGLNPIVYWVSNYLWDVINYLIPAFCCIIIFLAFNQKAYVSAANFPATFVLLLLYGWSMTPLMYPFSFFFDVPSTAYIVLICGNLFVGVIGTIATFILDFFGDDDQNLKQTNLVLKKVLLLFPNYCLGRGMMDLARNQLEADIYDRFGSAKFTDPFDWNIVGRNVFAMIIMSGIYLLITLFVQYRKVFFKPRSATIKSTSKELEEDVNLEKHRVLHEGKNSNDILRTENLTKLYRRRMLAVDGLTFGIKEGECFGLLGVNGAGKTSTFKMLTGDSSISAGDAYIKGFSVRTNMNKARQFMGYCPQFDALDELLTGKEVLSYFARIRGMSKSDGDKMAEWTIEMLGLSQYKDRRCGDYSGGNKRKLSTAIALLGSPPIIFLDEPTTGMDPGARRHLWNVVSGLLSSGKSVVLTSHSMEECETLCTRLAIMVNGEFKCLGSPQHLRSKYGMGYTLVIRAKEDCVEDVQDFVAANFVGSKLKDRHYYMLEYQVPTENLLLSQVFHKLELLRKTNSIEDYSVTQTTLDQIFVSFARKQVGAVDLDDASPAISADSAGELRMEDWPHTGHVDV